MTNGDENAVTRVVMSLISGHARSAPSSRINSCRSTDTANIAEKRYDIHGEVKSTAASYGNPCARMSTVVTHFFYLSNNTV